MKIPLDTYSSHPSLSCRLSPVTVIVVLRFSGLYARSFVVIIVVIAIIATQESDSIALYITFYRIYRIYHALDTAITTQIRLSKLSLILKQSSSIN